MHKQKGLVLSSSNGFASIVIILILAAIAVGGYLVFRTPEALVADNILPTPTRSIAPNVIATAGKTTPSPNIPSSTPVVHSSVIPADWNTYRDNVYKYEFSYPANWKFGSYDSAHSKGLVTGVAVDPEFVYSEEEAQQLDVAYGSFWIVNLERPYDYPTNYDMLPITYIGQDKVPARFEKEIFGDNEPNPSANNQTVLSNYVQFAN